MLRTADDLIGDRIAAIDGDIGTVRDIYFDDASWTVRYFVADTGGWLSGRLVLIGTEALTGAITDESHIPVELTRQQVEESPSIDADKPVSRQQELPYREYFGWPAYGGLPVMGSVLQPAPAVAAMAEQAAAEEHAEGDPHLRSVVTCTGYHIEAQDGEIGHVDDFLVDDSVGGDGSGEGSGWRIPYLVIGTRNWLPGKQVLVETDAIANIDWAQAEVRVRLTRDQIKGAPEYDGARHVDDEYARRLHDYYRSIT
jgi:hypothetical protein